MNFKIALRSILFSLLVIVVSGCISTGTDQEKLQLINDLKTAQNRIIDESWSSIFNNDYISASALTQKTIDEDRLKQHATRSSLYRAMGIANFGDKNEFETFDALYQSLLLNPTGPYSLVLVNFMVNETLWDITRLNKLTKLLEKTVNKKNTPSWLKNEYLYILEDYYRNRVGDIKKAINVRNELNLITNWKIIGPYSNISKSGYNKDYISISPDEESGLTNIGKGINNWDALSFTPVIQNRELQIPISSYFNYENYISIYAYHEFSLDKPSDYEFILSRKGSIEVWVNNEKVIDESNDTQSINRSYFTTYLNKGTNRILVKSNKLESSTSFNLSYNKIDIKPDYNISNFYKSLITNNSGYDPSIDSICKIIDSEENTQESLFWLSYALIMKGLEDQAYSILSMVDGEKKDSDLYQYLNALLLYEVGERPLYYKEIIKLAQKEHIFAPIQVKAIQNYISTGRDSKVETLFDKISTKNPDGFYTKYLDLLINNDKKSDDKVKIIYKDLKEKFPGISAVDSYMIYNQNVMTYNDKAEYISNLYGEGSFRTALYHDFNNNIKLRELDIARNQIEQYLGLYAINEPVWVDYIDFLINFYASDYDKIRSVIERSESTFPTSYDILDIDKEYSKSTYETRERYIKNNPLVFKNKNKAVKNYIAQKDSDKNSYKKSMDTLLKYYPYTLTLRDELRKFNEEKEFLDLFKIKDSYNLIEEYKESNFEHLPSDATIVYDSQRDLYFGDGSSTEFNHIILKLNTLSGIEANRFINLGFNPNSVYNHIYDAFTLKADGTRIEADFSGSEVAFNRLNPGDYIILSYRLDLYDYGVLNSEIFSNFTLESTYPIFKKELEMIYPKDLNVNFKYININAEEVEKISEDFETDFTKVSFSINKKEAKTYPNLSLNRRDLMQSVEFSTLESWEDILNWYKPIYEGQTIPSRMIIEKATELTKDKELQIDKIKSIFNFVANKIEYEDLSFQYDGYIPQSAESILKEGYGDCKDQSVLLISLLKAVGIPSYISLNTTYYNGNNIFLPSLVFDHALVGLDIDDQTIYLDPTLTYYNFGEMPSDRNGSYLLDIKDGGTIHKASYDIKSQNNTTILELTNIDNNVEISGSRIFQGGNAWGIRSKYNDLSLTDKKTIFEEDTNSWLPGFKMKSFNLENIEDIFTAPKIEFSGNMPSLITNVKENIVKVNTPWFDYLNSYTNYWLSVNDKSGTIAIPVSSVSIPKTQIMIIDIPSNYKPYSVPKEYKLTFKNCYINFTTEERVGKIILTREMFIPEQEVTQDEISEFKKFIESAINAEKEELYLTL